MSKEVCAVCLDKLDGSDRIVTACGHGLHLSCFVSVLKADNLGKQCPVCRCSWSSEFLGDCKEAFRADSRIDIRVELYFRRLFMRSRRHRRGLISGRARLVIRALHNAAIGKLIFDKFGVYHAIAYTWCSAAVLGL